MIAAEAMGKDGKMRKVAIHGGKTGPLTQKLYDAITAIQYGKAPDPHGWTMPVTPAR